jgi:adenine-specific DNA-methyltransferase
MTDHYDDYSREELIRELRQRDRRPHFGLVWERKEIEHEKAINEDFVALDFDAELSCGAAPYRNLIIEGDNFDALRYLRMTHTGKVKCIYIDPPYNTGNRDFIYNDRFIDKEDAYRHSKWLEFMYRRLELAKELLAEDGVIFVSIGEDEVFHLALLMDRVFGEENRIGTLIWKTRHSADSRNLTGVSIDHEYVLCFGARLKGVPIDENKFSNPDNDPRGPWRSADMTGLATKEQRPNLHYQLINPDNDIVYSCPNKGWRYELKTMQRLIEEKRIIWPSTRSGRPRLKKFLGELSTNRKGFSTLLNVALTSEGTKELTELGLGNGFYFPKPTGLIQQLIEQNTNVGDLVLDFFAGSGTTAHAVLKLNQEDSGNRRFILVSSTEATPDAPDKNLCRDVCAERMRRVISGYRNKKGESIAGLGGDLLTAQGAGFAYLRARRIPAEIILSQIEHEQIWTALQLIHTETLSLFDAAALMQRAEIDNGAILYIPKISATFIDTVKQTIHDIGIVIVYSWQSALLRQYIEDERASFQPIPQFLSDRFGLGTRP